MTPSGLEQTYLRMIVAGSPACDEPPTEKQLAAAFTPTIIMKVTF
jgi:hypothetical protein